MNDFPHESLDIYKAGLEFIAGADKMTKVFSPSRAYIGQQLNERAGGIVLNVAKGAAEPTPFYKAASYREGRWAAVEAAALLDVCRLLKLGDEATLATLRKSLLKVVDRLGDELQTLDALVPRADAPAAPAGAKPAAPPREEFI